MWVNDRDDGMILLAWPRLLWNPAEARLPPDQKD